MVIKRSVSLSETVADAVQAAADEDGVSFSGWLSLAAEHQLRVREGLRGVAAWEERAGELTPEEIEAGEALLARLLSGVAAKVRPGVAAMVRPVGAAAKGRRR
jgi:hypothetical protein